MRGKITKSAVDSLVASDAAAEVTLWDSEIRGFGVRARRGGAKTYTRIVSGGLPSLRKRR